MECQGGRGGRGEGKWAGPFFEWQVRCLLSAPKGLASWVAVVVVVVVAVVVAFFGDRPRSLASTAVDYGSVFAFFPTTSHVNRSHVLKLPGVDNCAEKLQL